MVRLVYPIRLAVIVALGTASGATAQQPEAPTGIRGVVTSSIGTPLPFAQVRLDDGRWQATADDQGRFEMLGVAAGTHRFAVRRLGYAALRDYATVTPGRVATYRVELDPIPLAAPTITVRARQLNIGAVQVAGSGQELAEAPDFSIRQYAARTWPWLRLGEEVGPTRGWSTQQPAVFPADWNGWDTALGQATMLGIDVPYGGPFVPAIPIGVPFGGGNQLQQRADALLAGCKRYVNGACVPDWYLDAIAPADLESFSVHRRGNGYVVVMQTRALASAN
ncbi:MAG: carboxypeptidase-like regulatory domain-containing protein [Gemmatimonadaceae bacterium]|nr:carboxypeptidase-like regulatory domain-containing protein [Gemmatimonadaceae bacterium]